MGWWSELTCTSKFIARSGQMACTKKVLLHVCLFLLVSVLRCERLDVLRITVGMDQMDSYMGSEALGKRGVSMRRCLDESNIVIKWDGMDKLWRHILQRVAQVSR